MSRWPTQRARGYQVRRCLVLDGIPEIYTECGGSRLHTATGDTLMAAPSGYTEQPCLDVRGSTSGEMDRKAGVETGRPWTAHLVHDWMDTTAGSLLFRSSDDAATSTAVCTQAATSITVDSTDGWDSSGVAWIGRERVAYSGKTATTLTGLTRGTHGPADYHPAGTRVTSRPTIWRGSRATLYRLLCCPAGRPLADTWGEVGPYQVVEWRGFLTETPVPSQHGLELRLSPLSRLLAQEVGAESRGVTVPPLAAVDPGRIVASEADSVTIFRDGSTSARVTGGTGVITVAEWCAAATTAWATAWGAYLDLAIIYPSETGKGITFGFVTATALPGWAGVEPAAWWLEPGRTSLPIRWLPTTGVARGGRVDYAADADTGWLELAVEPDEYGTTALDTSGTVAITCGGVTEVVAYDTRTDTGDPSSWVVRVYARDRQGTGRAPIWTEPGTWARVSLLDGSAGVAALTLMQSSGAGNRGTYDTMAHARGLAIDDAHIDEDRWLAYPLGDTQLVAAPDEPESLETTLGGWLALHQLCAVMLDGVLTVRSWAPVAGSAISVADVLTGTHTPAETIQGPGSVQVRVGDTAIATVVDPTAVQAMGAERWEIQAPGADRTQATWLAGDLLRLADGVSVVRLGVPQWDERDKGDAVTLTTAHPSVYSWASGRAPTTINGSVVAREDKLDDDTAILTVLLEGPAGASQWLCPSLRVTSMAGQVATVTGDVTLFPEGDPVLTYTPGVEDVMTRATVARVSGQDVTVLPWLDGYLDCDGTAWAEAAGAMTAVSAPYTRVVVVQVGTGTGGLAGTDTNEGFSISVASTPSATADLVGEGGLAIGSIATPASEPAVLALTPLDAADTPTFRSVWAASDGVLTDGPYVGDTPTPADDIQIAYYLTSIAPTGTRIYADLVITGAAPTVAELRALLTTPPWEVWAPSRLARCYLPEIAYESGADVIIPDVAAAVGGPNAAVNAVMQAGGIGDIVVSGAIPIAGDVITYPRVARATTAQAEHLHVTADDRWQ